MLKRLRRAAALGLLGTCIVAPIAEAQDFRVLVFSKTAGFRHGSISDGISMIQALGASNNFAVDTTENGSAFTAANLGQYAAVVWLNTTGDVLTSTQQSAFRNYVEGGGSWVGIHAATDCEYGWTWYGTLIGGNAWFDSHPAQQTATLDVENQTHGSTSHLPASLSMFEEWYNFQNNPRSSVQVLVTIDESSYTGGNMGSDHPVSWYHDVGDGRSWYTALGHRSETYSDPAFRNHVLGGILWAAGAGNTPSVSCTGVPIGGCMSADRGSLDIDERKPGKEKWKSTVKNIVPTTTQADFGDPVNGATGYAVCVYDGFNLLRGELQLDRAGHQCGSKPCWKDAAAKGWKYNDKAAVADGVNKMQSKSGAAGKGQIQTRAKNDASKGKIALPTGIAAALAGNGFARMQIVTNDAQCFDVALSKIQAADGTRFKASTP